MMACGSAGSGSANSNDSIPDNTVAKAEFCGDSAFAFVKAQCDFGARVPGTPAHKAAADYMVDMLKSWGAQVIEQKAPITTFDNTKIEIRNIIAQFNTDAAKRILLIAHYDCRPWADADPVDANRHKPVLGANDAASGVGVLLEVARQMGLKAPNIGVDILLCDLEDWGEEHNEESWALGTQYWASHPHVDGYRPMFGILLDMVGGAGATFSKEYFSTRYAGSVVNEVWNIAAQCGYGSVFVNSQGGAITDDHIAINRAGIPCIDIIHTVAGSDTGFFGAWHTTSDTLDNISTETLTAVGTVITTLIRQY